VIVIWHRFGTSYLAQLKVFPMRPQLAGTETGSLSWTQKFRSWELGLFLKNAAALVYPVFSEDAAREPAPRAFQRTWPCHVAVSLMAERRS